jgi:integrase
LTENNLLIYDLSAKGGLQVPKASLTSRFIRQSVCPAGVRKIDFFDESFPGFMLEIRASGGKTFYQRYRDAYGRERQFKIGPAHVLTATQARRKARAIVAEAILGSDPQKERQELRSTPTLSQFVRETYLPFAKNAKRSWRTDETVLRLHILPELGHFALDQVSDQTVVVLLRQLREAGYASGTTNRVLVLLRFMFNLGRKWGVPGCRDNPTIGLKTTPDVCRQRFLTNEEAQRLLLALDADENRIAAFAVKLLLLTGGRRNEITYAKWEYVSWDERTLLVPIAKSGRSRLIRLNTPALELLRSLPRLQGNPYIFPSPITGRPSASLHFPWSRIRKRCGLLDVRLHDLRHSFASFLVNRGISLYIVQGLLGHSQVRATQRYAHLTSETLLDAAEVVRSVILPSGDAPIASEKHRWAGSDLWRQTAPSS